VDSRRQREVKFFSFSSSVRAIAPLARGAARRRGDIKKKKKKKRKEKGKREEKRKRTCNFQRSAAIDATAPEQGMVAAFV